MDIADDGQGAGGGHRHLAGTRGADRHSGAQRALDGSAWPWPVSKDPANEGEKDALSGGPSRYAGVMMKGLSWGFARWQGRHILGWGKVPVGQGANHTRQSVLPKPKPKVRRGASHKDLTLPQWEGQQTHTWTCNQAGAPRAPQCQVHGPTMPRHPS